MVHTPVISLSGCCLRFQLLAVICLKLNMLATRFFFFLFLFFLRYYVISLKNSTFCLIYHSHRRRKMYLFFPSVLLQIFLFWIKKIHFSRNKNTMGGCWKLKVFSPPPPFFYADLARPDHEFFLISSWSDRELFNTCHIYTHFKYS